MWIIETKIKAEVEVKVENERMEFLVRSMLYYLFTMKKTFTIFFLLLLLTRLERVNAAMTGGSYEIYADSIGVTGLSEASSSEYSISASVGEVAASSTSGGTYELRGGYQALDKGLLSFSLDKSSVSLGAIRQSSISSASIVATVDTDANTGYTLSVTESGNLQSGSNDINDVGDGSVTAGSEEYGIRTSGGSGILTSDTAISGSTVVASASGVVHNDQTTVTFRASAGQSTKAGSYSQTLTFTVTVNP